MRLQPQEQSRCVLGLHLVYALLYNELHGLLPSTDRHVNIQISENSSSMINVLEVLLL